MEKNKNKILNEKYEFIFDDDKYFDKIKFEKSTIDKYIKDLELEKWYEKKIEGPFYTKQISTLSTVREAINIFGFKAILLEFLKDHQTEELLNMIPIKDIQGFLRKKKLEQLKKE